MVLGENDDIVLSLNLQFKISTKLLVVIFFLQMESFEKLQRIIDLHGD